MLVAFYFLLIAVSLIALTIAGAEFVNGVYRFRGPRVVSCPADGKKVGIQIDANHAAASKVRRRGDAYRVTQCTSWPERALCDQRCLDAVVSNPDASLLRVQLEPWYEEHGCALCGNKVLVVPPDGEGPGFLRRSDRAKLRWDELPLENFPEALSSMDALCPSCRSGPHR